MLTALFLGQESLFRLQRKHGLPTVARRDQRYILILLQIKVEMAGTPKIALAIVTSPFFHPEIDWLNRSVVHNECWTLTIKRNARAAVQGHLRKFRNDCAQ